MTIVSHEEITNKFHKFILSIKFFIPHNCYVYDIYTSSLKAFNPYLNIIDVIISYAYKNKFMRRRDGIYINSTYSNPYTEDTFSIKICKTNFSPIINCMNGI